MIKNECSMCLKSRPIISENGIHYICCMSSKKAMDCVLGIKNYFVKNPMVKTNEHINEV